MNLSWHEKGLKKFLMFLAVFAFLLAGCQDKKKESSSSKEKDEEVLPVAEQPKGPPVVFFVGNSLTYNHDIPKKFGSLLEQNNIKASGYQGVQSDVAGARSLDGGFFSMIHKVLLDKNSHPKFLVLQEQSNGWSFNDTKEIIEYYKSVASEIGATIVLYQTWNKLFPQSRKSSCRWSGKTFDNSVPKQYLTNGAKYSLAVAPVAEAWESACRKSLTVPLTPHNDYHADAAGAYAAAYTFVYTLFPNQPKVPSVLDAQIPASDMQKLNDSAYEAVKAQKQTKFIPPDPRVKDDIGGTIETAKRIVNLKNNTLTVRLETCDVDLYFIEPTPTPQKLKISGNKYDWLYVFLADGKKPANWVDDWRNEDAQKFDTSTTQRIYLYGIQNNCNTAKPWTWAFNVKLETL